MQRGLLVIVLALLLTASLAVGTLAAAWPFWSRALAWHGAPDGWPAPLPGPARQLQASAAPAPIAIRVDPALDDAALASRARLLLVADGPETARAYYAPGIDEHSTIDGRGLAAGLLPLLFVALEQQHPGLLDEPVSRYLPEWSRDPRGDITPRLLMWELGGLAGSSRPRWNPFDAHAQLLAGLDFGRAALSVRQTWPAATTHAHSPANAQLLALVAARLTTRTYGDLLEERLWRQLAAGKARAPLDHPRGEIAAHCCVEATAADWLRVALLLAQRGQSGDRSVLPAQALAMIPEQHPVNPGQGLVWRVGRFGGYEVLMLPSPGRLLAAAPGNGRALFWAGEGELSAEQAAGLLLQGNLQHDRTRTN
jgi:hypothetical protein